MRIGFTGTRNGMTEDQCKTFLELIARYNPVEFHHGCCKGADLQAHKLLKKHIAIKRIGHPPLNLKLAEIPSDLDEVREKKPYLVRNDSIVAETEILIAAPEDYEEKVKSGTWYTVRKARKGSKNIFIIFPNGAIENEF
jgi:NADPH-dependent glutamate synthase beta subunit-like oxidoreductase